MNYTKIFLDELNRELKENILPFWISKMTDNKNGGFYGRIDGNDVLHPEADKGIILNSRILWTFSAAYLYDKTKDYKKMADRAFHYIANHFLDKQNGGVFWLLDYKGTPKETKKQIYAQAFTIYSLAEYYKINKHRQVLEHAISIYHHIERYAYDQTHGGYFEAYNRKWELLKDLRLSDKDANEKKSMNTHLHLLEAYTNLYRVWRNKELLQKLEMLINDFIDHILDNSTFHFNLFFNDQWDVKSQTISYGHDIEGSWLLLEAALETKNSSLIEHIKSIAVKIADTTIAEGLDDDGAIIYEKHLSHIDFDRHWWPQAEAMVGFVNACQLTKDNKYLDYTIQLWNFIKNNIIDHKNGEWYFRVNRNGLPYKEEDKAGIWKCTYHNSRACIEIINRLKSLE